ncbi:MAG: DUF2760 domain-containing protein [Bacteroidales bacterium]
MSRLSIAFRCFFSLLFKGTISETLFGELRSRVAPRGVDDGDHPARETTPVRSSVEAPRPAAAKQDASALAGGERAVQVLALLQRDARLIDFIKEDIADYDDAQVGAAVRDMHASCRATIDRYLTLEPVMAGEEGTPVTVQPGFEPGTIKLLGNVTGKLPVRGVLRHKGWRTRAVRLPDLPSGGAVSVVAPAEVEVS